MATAQSETRPRRELTGRGVLLWLFLFFGVVFAVNAIMVRAATSTFGGLETSSSYQAGLKFSREQAAAQKQQALQWKVTVQLARAVAGSENLTVAVLDRDGKAPPDIALRARLIHPADGRRDHDVTMRPDEAGRFTGRATAEAGQWDLEIDILRGDERLFRSRSRVRVE